MYCNVRVIRRLVFGSVLLISLILGGCKKSEPDYYTLVKNAKEIQPGAKVLWQGVNIGSVTRVQPEEGKIRIDIDLDQQYHSPLRVGVAAKVMRDYNDPTVSVVRLFGGDDTKSPMLEPYCQIPEASLFDTVSARNVCEWLWTSHAKWTLSTCTALVLLLMLVTKFIRGAVRFIIIAALICFIVGAIFFVNEQWREYNLGGAVSAADMVQAIENSLKTNEAREILKSAKVKLIESLKELPNKGSVQLVSVKMHINEQIEKQMKELKHQDKNDILADVKKDQAIISELLTTG